MKKIRILNREIEVPVYDEKGKIVSTTKKELKDWEFPETQYEIRLKYGNKVAEMFEYQYYLAFSIDYKDFFGSRNVASQLSTIKALTKIACLPPIEFRGQDFWNKSGLLPPSKTDK